MIKTDKKKTTKKKASSKKANPKKCRVIKVRRKISMGAGKRPRVLQVRRKVCNPETKPNYINELEELRNTKVKLYKVKSPSKSIATRNITKLIIHGLLRRVSPGNGLGFEVLDTLTDKSFVFSSNEVLLIQDKNIYIRLED